MPQNEGEVRKEDKSMISTGMVTCLMLHRGYSDCFSEQQNQSLSVSVFQGEFARP